MQSSARASHFCRDTVAVAVAAAIHRTFRIGSTEW